MAQKRKTDQTKLNPEAARQRIAAAALDLADAQGWGHIAIESVAKKAKFPAATVETFFPDVFAILKWVLKNTEETVRHTVDGHLGDNWRDNLMEIIMQRFEIAQTHRAGYATIAKALAKHPKTSRFFVHGFYRTMDRTLKLAGLDKGKCQPAIVIGFGAIYLSLADTWLKDESADMARTMAAIDKRIGWFEQALNYMSKK